MFHIVPQKFQHAPLCGVAAPIGRTQCGGRSRAIGPFLALLATPVFADALSVPSQAHVEPLEFLEDATDPDAVVFRARYLMPEIARATGTLSYDDVIEDFVVLCESHALPLIRSDGFSPARIVVSLSDRPTEFGVPNPDATQIFEAFTVDDDACIWEQF